MSNHEELTLKKGMYAVHNKYNPGFVTDTYNYVYELKGIVMNTSDDSLYRLYLPLYQLTENSTIAIGEEFPTDFEGFTRMDGVFLENKSPESDRPRFKFFESKESLDIFLSKSRLASTAGNYEW
jgi:hypothetical protein